MDPAVPYKLVLDVERNNVDAILLARFYPVGDKVAYL